MKPPVVALEIEVNLCTGVTPVNDRDEEAYAASSTAVIVFTNVNGTA